MVVALAGILPRARVALFLVYNSARKAGGESPLETAFKNSGASQLHLI